MVGARAHHDHRAALGGLGVLGELARHAGALGGRHVRDRLLPGRRVLAQLVVVAGRPDARHTGTRDAVLGEHEVEDRRHDLVTHTAHRHAAVQRRHLGGRVVEGGQHDLGGLGAVTLHGEARLNVAQLQVPLAEALVAPAMAEGAVGNGGGVRRLVPQGRLELRVLGALGVVLELGRHQELAGLVRAVVLLVEDDQERQVGVLLHVAVEVRHRAVDEELLEHDVPHRHAERGVRAGGDGQPLVGELHVLGVVGAHHDDLLAAVAGLGHPVGVRGAGERDVRAPHHEVAGVPPVARLGHVGLIAEHLRRGRRQVGVPVVEAQHGAADEAGVAGAGGVGDHRHGRDGGEARDAVGAPALDDVSVRGGDDLDRLVPGRAHQAALAAGRLVALALHRVLHDRGPGQHGVAVVGLLLAVHLEQRAADVGVAHARRRVGVPAERRAARATAGLVVGLVGPGRRVVGLLGLPRDDAVLDVHLPGARAGAVHAVGRADDLVVGPTVAVEPVGPAALVEHGAAVGALLAAGEEASGAAQGGARLGVSHDCPLWA